MKPPFQEINTCVVRFVNSSGSIGTLAGNGTCVYTGDGMQKPIAEMVSFAGFVPLCCFRIAGGPATAAAFLSPRSMYVENQTLYVCDGAFCAARDVCSLRAFEQLPRPCSIC